MAVQFTDEYIGNQKSIGTLIARFMGPTWGPSGADRTQVGPMLAPWTLLSGLGFPREDLCVLSTLWGYQYSSIAFYIVPGSMYFRTSVILDTITKIISNSIPKKSRLFITPVSIVHSSEISYRLRQYLSFNGMSYVAKKAQYQILELRYSNQMSDMDGKYRLGSRQLS